MFRIPFLNAALGIGMSAWVMHGIAMWLHLYFTFSWLDLVVHVFGGAAISLLVISLYFYAPLLGGPRSAPRRQLFAVGIGGAIVVGVCWELFEFSVGMIMAAEPFYDTLLDLVMDVFGGVLATGVVDYNRPAYVAQR